MFFPSPLENFALPWKNSANADGSGRITSKENHLTFKFSMDNSHSETLNHSPFSMFQVVIFPHYFISFHRSKTSDKEGCPYLMNGCKDLFKTGVSNSIGFKGLAKSTICDTTVFIPN